VQRLIIGTLGGNDPDGTLGEWFCGAITIPRREGHCSPARKYVEDKFNLGSWVATQRYYYHRGFLLAERKRQLDAVGFVWDPLNDRWEHGFAALLKFKKRTGHCRVPVIYRTRSVHLGYWVSSQRRNKDDMAPERRKRLKKIGFVWCMYDEAAKKLLGGR